MCIPVFQYQTVSYTPQRLWLDKHQNAPVWDLKSQISDGKTSWKKSEIIPNKFENGPMN